MPSTYTQIHLHCYQTVVGWIVCCRLLPSFALHKTKAIAAMRKCILYVHEAITRLYIFINKLQKPLEEKKRTLALEELRQKEEKEKFYAM